MKKRTYTVVGSATGKNVAPTNTNIVYVVSRQHTASRENGKIYMNSSTDVYASVDDAYRRYIFLISKEIRSNGLPDIIGNDVIGKKNRRWGFHLDGSWDIFLRDGVQWVTTKILLEKKEVK